MLHLYKGKIKVDEDNLRKSESIAKIASTFSSDMATKILIYIYLMYNRSEDNPFKDFSEEERSHRSKEVAFGSSSPIADYFSTEELRLITKAIKEYSEEFVDKMQKDIDLYDKKMYEFIELLDKNKPEIQKNIHTISSKVSFSTNIDIITSVLDNAIEIILDKAALTHLKKTGKWSSELRGGLSPHVKGKTHVEID